MSETTQEERDEWRIGIDPILHPASCKRITLRPDQVVRLINDADRLAAIRQLFRGLSDEIEREAQGLYDDGLVSRAATREQDADDILAILKQVDGS